MATDIPNRHLLTFTFSYLSLCFPLLPTSHLATIIMGKDSSSDGAPVAQCNAFEWVNFELTCPALTDNASYLTSTSIRISTGKPETSMQSFTVHQQLVSTRSEFFAKALRGGDWKEAEERTVVLPDDEPEVFRLYLQLLYVRAPVWFGSDANTMQTGSVTLNSVARGDDAYVVLSRLYVLAEKLIDETAKTSILAALSACDGKRDSQGAMHCPSFESIKIIYNGTPDDSAARKCIVELYSKCAAKSSILDLFSSTQKLPHDFLSDLIKSVVNVWPLPQELGRAERKIKQLQFQLQDLRSQLNGQLDRYLR